MYDPSRGNKLVALTGGVMVVGTLWKNSQASATAKAKPGQPLTGTGNSGASRIFNTFHSLWAIAIVIFIMAVVAEQAPEFGGPFALLVLVAYLIKNTQTLQAWANSALGSNK